MSTGLIIWGIVVITIIAVFIYKAGSNINNQYKYNINIDKVGFDKFKLPLIKLNIRGLDKYFLVDTGANSNVLSMDIIDLPEFEDKIHVVGELTQLGGGGVSEVVKEIQECVRTEDEAFTIKFSVSNSYKNLADAIKAETGLEVVGLIGSPFLEKAKWIIDLDSLVIWAKK